MSTINADLFNAVSKSDFPKIKELIDQGADVNTVDTELMETPLLVAIGNNNVETAKFLLEKGANTNPDHTTVYTLPLNLAVDVSFETSKNDSGAETDALEMIKLLLDFGAEIKNADKDGENAYEFAKDCHLPAQKLFEDVMKK